MKNNIKSIEKQAKIIKAQQQKYKGFGDEDIKRLFSVFCDRYKKGEIDQDLLMTHVYALVAEASTRVFGLDPHLEQIMGAICLHNGDVASMLTGEGKTLTSTMPAVLGTVTHGNVHIATANEYLARRDSEEMGRLYNYFGLQVGLISQGQSKEDKRKAYSADITYGKASEFGFDYLRDNLAISKNETTGQRRSFVIVDEADSILLDEATIPLIFSKSLSRRQFSEQSKFITIADNFVRSLDSGDYEIDYEKHDVSLTDVGVVKCEEAFKSQMTEEDYLFLSFCVNNALKAHHIIKKDDDYIVQDNRIVLVDKHTGRAMEGRELSNGMHQALQAKEGVPVLSPSIKLASISFQRYFGMYSKIAGMTGTPENTSEEFNVYYGMEIKEIPPHKSCVRQDMDPQIYMTVEDQIEAFVREVKRTHQTGQPILIGSATVEQSIALKDLLSSIGIEADVLNAETKKEADIISCAGRLGKVTIATNVAGRGTDIKLGGNPVTLTKLELEKQGVELSIAEETIVFASKFSSTDEKLINARNIYLGLTTECKQEKQQVEKVGGLKVIATSIGETERDHKQLIGRSGRQGDVGSSVIISSIYDPVLVDNCKTELQELIKSSNGKVDNDGMIKPSISKKILALANRRSENGYRQSRTSNLKMDQIIDSRRDATYGDRDKILSAETPDEITECFNLILSDILDIEIEKSVSIQELKTSLESVFGSLAPSIQGVKLGDKNLKNTLMQRINESRAKMIMLLDPADRETHFQFERIKMIEQIDNGWIDFINEVDNLKQGSILKAYANSDPYDDYTLNAADYYESVMNESEKTAIYNIFKKLEAIRTNQSSDESGSQR